MNRFLSLAVASIALGACAKKAEAPQIQLTDIGFTLQLPTGMQKALDSIAPGFRSVQTSSYRSDVPQAAAAGGGGVPALFAATGDFDHDGSVDAVVEGAVRGDSSLRVIAIMNGKKPKAIDVARFASYDADAVGIYITRPTGGQQGAFEVVSYPDSSMLYRYDSGAFEETTLGK